MEPTYKETILINPREYCPNRKVPLDIVDILKQQVNLEDAINHADDPVPELPRCKEIKVRHPQWVKNWVRGTLGQLLP